MLAAVEAGCEVVEYTPAEVKRAVVGYGRAEKPQVQMMVKLLLGLTVAPSPHDAADALAVAICHLHSVPQGGLKTRLDADARAAGKTRTRSPRSWRQYRPPANG
jgi:crossover junction endodeoxyribonuclease RuvC